MASQQFVAVKSLIISYIGEEKGLPALERQLKHCSAAPESFSAEDLRKISTRIIAAISLYIAEEDKKNEFKKRVETMAA